LCALARLFLRERVGIPTPDPGAGFKCPYQTTHPKGLFIFFYFFPKKKKDTYCYLFFFILFFCLFFE